MSAQPLLGRLKRDVVVVGGGLAGLSTALELVRRGRQVTVLSRDESEAASTAAGGMIAPQAERLDSGAYLDLCLASRAIYTGWVSEIESLARVGRGGAPNAVDAAAAADAADTGFWSSGGFLAPAFDGDAVHEWAPPPEGGQAEWLGGDAIRAMEPLLSPELVGGWWFPQDLNVDARRLHSVLGRACVAAGVEILRGVAAEGISFSAGDGRRAEAVLLADGRRMEAAAVVAATGAWLRELVPVPMAPHKGQMLSLRVPRAAFGRGSDSASPAPLSRVLFAEGAYIIPKRDGRIVVGATVEPGEWSLHTTPRGVAELSAAAARLCPALADFALEETWAGLRPVTPDTLPVLGGSQRWDNVFVAGGYWRNGVALAPKTGQLVADAVMGTLSLEDASLASSFGMDRFLLGGRSGGSDSGVRRELLLRSGAKAPDTPPQPPPAGNVYVPAAPGVQLNGYSGGGGGGSGGGGRVTSGAKAPESVDVTEQDIADYEAAALRGAEGGRWFEGLRRLFGPGGSGPVGDGGADGTPLTSAAAAAVKGAGGPANPPKFSSEYPSAAAAAERAFAAPEAVAAAAKPAAESSEAAKEYVTDYDESEFFNEEEMKRARQSNRNLDEVFLDWKDDEEGDGGDVDPALRPGAWEPEGQALAEKIGATIVDAEMPEGVSIEDLKANHIKFAKVTWLRKDGPPVVVPYGTNIYRMAAEAEGNQGGAGSSDGSFKPPAAAGVATRVAPGPHRSVTAVRGEGERPPEVAAAYEAIAKNKARAREGSGGGGGGGAAAAAGSGAAAVGGSGGAAATAAEADTRGVNGHVGEAGGEKGGWRSRLMRGFLGAEKGRDGAAAGASQEAAAVAGAVEAAAEAAAVGIESEEDRLEAAYDAYEHIMQHRQGEAGVAGSDSGDGEEIDVAKAARMSNRLDLEEEAALFESIAMEAQKSAVASLGNASFVPRL